MERFRLKADDAILLVIDLQEKLMPTMDRREEVYKNTVFLLNVAAQYKLPVIVTEQYPRGLGTTVPEIAKALPEGSGLVEKVTFDACGNGLLDTLAATGRKTVLVCGCETHVCVYQTVRSMLVMGYKVFVAGDAVCSRFPANYQSGLQLMAEMGAVVISSEGAAFAVMQVAGTPEVKGSSNLLK